MAETLNIFTKKNPRISEIEEKNKPAQNNGTCLHEIILSKKEYKNSGNKPAALFLLDKDRVIVLMEGDGLEELQLNKYELIGGHIHEEFPDCPLILKVINKAIEDRKETVVCKISKKIYEIFISYSYKKKDDLTGILILVTKTASEHNKSKRQLKNTCFQQFFEKSPDAVVILDGEDKIVQSNGSFQKLFGYELHETFGKNIFQLIQPPHLLSEISEIKDTIEKSKFLQMETERMNSKGVSFDVSLQSYSIDIGEEKTGSYHIYRDITRKKLKDESIKNTLLEKEMLLKEVHHRVKNNLQIVSSLLYLQTKSLKDKKIIDVFLESQNRVKSIALIHERIYQSANLSRIDFERYLSAFIPHLFQTFGKTDGNIDYKIKAGNIFLSTDTAIPCGLIINEIVTNSLKYAFSNLQKGEISIELIYHNNNNVTLIVKDNGIGLPDGINLTNAKTLGLQIISILVKQLNGKIEISNQKGTVYKITFPFIEYKFR